MTCDQPPPRLRSFSFGGGWQSTAALVLAARGVIDFRTFLFANVGDDSENPETIEYVHQHAMPFAATTWSGERYLTDEQRLAETDPGEYSAAPDDAVRAVFLWPTN